jgi:seryl-tRNA(Sec) selenium transferase
LCFGQSTGAVTVLGSGGTGSYQYKIGSGSLPVERLPSVALAISAVDRVHEKRVVRLERLLRGSDIAVIGRLSDKTLLLDLRCLTADKETVFVGHVLAATTSLLTVR